MYGHIFFLCEKAQHLSISYIINNMSSETEPSVILCNFKIFCQAYVSNMNFWLLAIFQKDLLQRFWELH